MGFQTDVYQDNSLVFTFRALAKDSSQRQSDAISGRF